ncbi:MAG: DUF2029 domain-containing protein [Anaerolineae bacterium]|nr:DUF2029 domain-containing protein [Anaerolineae bacterium]
MTGQRRGGSEIRLYWIIIAAGLILRLIIAPWGGHPGDLASMTGWATALDAHGLSAVYATSDANYPPLALAILSTSCWGYRLLGGGEWAGPLWWVMLKLPIILADMGIGLLIWRLAQRHKRVTWLAASVALNPVLIYLSAWWGQYESLYMLGALAALTAVLEDRPWWAGVALGLGVMIKLQAAVIAPLVLLVLLSGPRRIVACSRFGVGLAMVLLVAVGPFVWIGQGELVIRRLVAVIAGPNWPTINALNAWYLATGGTGNWAYNQPLTWPDTAPIIAGFSARTIGTAMLSVWTLSILAMSRRGMTSSGSLGQEEKTKKAPWIRWAVCLQSGALLYLGVFMWPTQAHERYAFGAVVLLAGAAAVARQTDKPLVRPSLFYSLITVLCTVNLLWAAPFAGWMEGWFAGEHVIGSIVALMFVLSVVWGGYQLYRYPAASQ